MASVIMLRRFFSTAGKTKLVYNGPLAKPVRMMKGVSMTSSALTLVGMPMVLAAQPEVMVGQIAMCGTVMLFSLGTTTLFHLLFRPYISKIHLDEQGQQLSVETFSLLAQPKQTSFCVEEIKPIGKSFHPMVSFYAKDHPFFLHPECVQDEQLLKQINSAAGKS